MGAKDQSTCVADETCSDAQIKSRCVPGSCTATTCTCSEGYLNPIRDPSICEEEVRCTPKQVSDHCQTLKCISDNCECEDTFSQIAGKPGVCEPHGQCSSEQLEHGCAPGFCPNEGYCGCKEGYVWEYPRCKPMDPMFLMG